MAMLSSLKPTIYQSFTTPFPVPPAGGMEGDSQALAALPEIARPTSMAERWASYVLRACKSERDPRTIAIWARQAAVSYTTLCESCRLIDIQPRDARDFTRVLRLMVSPSFDSRQLAAFLDVSDRRTLDSILQKAGFGQHATGMRDISVASFLDNQQFIECGNTGLKIIREVFL